MIRRSLFKGRKLNNERREAKTEISQMMKYDFYSNLAICEKKEQREQERKRILKKTNNALSRLNQKISFSEAYLFGSVIQEGNFTENSDVDIAFRGLTDKDFFRTMAFLSREIGRDVDVIQLEQHPFKEKISTIKFRKWTKKS
jgi:predicted nucleotidyltransferase